MKYTITSGVLAALLLAQASAASAADPCWPATADNPLEDELIVMSSGGSLTGVMEEIIWNAFAEQCGVDVQQYTLANRSLDQMNTLITSGDVPFDHWPSRSSADTNPANSGKTMPRPISSAAGVRRAHLRALARTGLGRLIVDQRS